MTPLLYRLRMHVPLVSAIVLILLFLCFATSLPTTTARWLWSHYHANAAALFLDRTDATLAFVIGNESFESSVSHDIPLAERAYRKAVRLKSSLTYGHYQLARVLFVQGNLPEALTEINNELKYHPEHLRALYVRGLIRAYSKDLVGAESDFQSFTEWAPTEWAGYNDLAWVLGQEGKYVEAETALKKGLENATDADTNPWLWNNLGVQQLNLGKYSDATVSFTKAKELAETLSDATWAKAYPGNNPSESSGGLALFLQAIDTNLAKAYAGKSIP